MNLSLVFAIGAALVLVLFGLLCIGFALSDN